jgi:hypothetical protein
MGFLPDYSVPTPVLSSTAHSVPQLCPIRIAYCHKKHHSFLFWTESRSCPDTVWATLCFKFFSQVRPMRYKIALGSLKRIISETAFSRLDVTTFKALHFLYLWWPTIKYQCLWLRLKEQAYIPCS